MQSVRLDWLFSDEPVGATLGPIPRGSGEGTKILGFLGDALELVELRGKVSVPSGEVGGVSH